LGTFDAWSCAAVTLPSQPEPAFEAGSPKAATGASASAGAPPHAVVAADPEPPKKKKQKKEEKSATEAKKKQPGRLPLPPDAREKMAALKHYKCRFNGCPQCRSRIGLVLNEDETAWVYST